MAETAEALSANQKSRRNVTIEITNITNGYCLVDPKVYLENGNVHSPPQPTVRPMRTEVCNFSKTSAKASGAVGVLTYDLFDRRNNCTRESIAIMFSVPYDFNMYKNWFAVGIFPKDDGCDEKLYKKMYYDKEQTGFVREEAKGGGIIYQGRAVDVLATMCPLGRAMMKVEVWDQVFPRQ